MEMFVGYSYRTFFRNSLERQCPILLWGTFTEHSRSIGSWDILIWCFYGALLWNTLVGHFCGIFWWDILVRQSCRTLLRGILAEYFYRIVLWDITLSFFHGIYVCLFLSVDVLGYDTIDSKLWLIVSLLFVYLIYF